MTQGRLFGVGTGPGDPQLVTRRAWSLIEKAEVVAYPAPDSGTSFARSIVAEAIRSDAVEIPMVVPMRPGRAPAQAIYDRGAADIALHLEAGRDVVVLCEGDPLFYGSFMYLLVRLADRFDVEIVPGVTSLSACAAAQVRPLVARSDRLTVLPGTLDDADLEVGDRRGGGRCHHEGRPPYAAASRASGPSWPCRKGALHKPRLAAAPGRHAASRRA